MGLDLRCKDESVSMPYSCFFRVREAIADATKLPIYFMEGFLDTSDGELHFTLNIKDLKDVYRIGIPIKWNTLRYDTLHNLINHSDCDGTLSWRIAGKIAKRLKEIKDKVRFENFNIREDTYNKLIGLCKYSHENKKHIEFW